MIPPNLFFDETIPVVDFHQKKHINQKNQLGGDLAMPEEKAGEEEQAEAEDETYYPYLKQKLNMHLIYDTTIYKDRYGVHPHLNSLFKIDTTLGLYDPILFLSDFWVLTRDLI